MNAAASAALRRIDRLFAVPRGPQGNIPALAGLRAVAVFLVFLTHYTSQFAPWLDVDTTTGRLAATIADLGNCGVDLFFVISGYLIYGTLLRSQHSLRTFFARRIVRIYPAFSAVLLLYIGIAFVFDPSEKLPRDAGAIAPYLLANFLLLPGMLTTITPLITVAWSLSFEAFFYLTVPLFVLALDLRRRSAATRIGAIGVLTVAGAALIPVAPDHARLLMFTAGMFLFELTRRPHRRQWPIALVSAVVVLVSLANIPASWQTVPWGTGILWIGLIAIGLDALHWQTVTARLLAWSPLQWLGNMSYSYYLLHGLTLKTLFVVVPLALPVRPNADVWYWLLLPPALAATLLPAALLFVWVEKPYSFPGRPMERFSDRPAPAMAGAL